MLIIVFIIISTICRFVSERLNSIISFFKPNLLKVGVEMINKLH